ncbi:MAG: smc, partial [Labilithrix sp.]|nr:smc [Labilithrix sp.]
MKLKSLVIHGFKSFADKTLIEFHSGVTGIVGPNGCGKSNVVDAVRWVLGETSAKALRGGEMSDVIFNGTDKRKPHAMAEVVLTFSDCEQALGVDYNEVSIGRRVFRDGKGEYELNGQQCRAKDIARLFMDTGVGRNMYSIMEQGKIDMLLSAKPEDRRQVFEEAAGITKSKAEKKEAMRKLEYTEANLLRVTDILSEMKRQIGSAQRQAGKAKRYQELHRDVTVLDTHLHFKKWSEMSVEKAELDTSISSLRLRSADLEQQLDRDERGLTDARMELAELEAQIGSLRNQLNQTQGQINAANHRIESNTERVREWNGLIEQYDGEVEGGQERMIQQEDELCRIGDELMQIEVQLDAKKSAMEEQNRAAQSLREERALHERNLQEARQAMHTAEGIIISAGAEMSSHTAQAVTDQQRQEQLQRDLNAMEEERAAKQREEEEIKARLEEMTAELEQLHVDAHSRERESQEITSELEITQRQIHEQHRAFSEKQSKLNVLRQLIQAGEGLEKGTQAVLGGLGNKEKFAAGTHGLLSTYLEVTDPLLIPAIEAAMGGHLQTILVEDADFARQIIETLKSQQLGTAEVLPQNRLNRGHASQMQVLPEGAVAWALDRIRVKEAVRPAIHQLLGNVCLAPNLETALRLKQEMPDVAFATITGEYISAEGTIRGGAGKEQAGSILQRQAELHALETEVAQLEESLFRAEALRDDLQERQRAAKTASEEQREMLQVRRVAESTLQGQFSLVQRETAQFTNKLGGVEWELSELAKRQEALARKVDEATARRARAEEELEDRRAQSAEMVELLEIRRRDETEAMDRLNELKTALAVELRTRQALQEQRAPMQARLRELEEALGKRRREVETFREKILAAEDETEAMVQGIAEGREQVTELSQVLETRSGERAERAAQLASSEIGLNAIRREVSKLNEQRGSEEVRVTKIGLRMESLMTYAQERYRINLAAFEQDAHALLVSIRHQKSMQGRSEKRRASFEVNQDESYEAASAESAAVRDEDEAFAAGVVSEEGPDWEFVES